MPGSPRPAIRLPAIGLAPRLVALAVLLTTVTGSAIALWVLDNARATLRDEILELHLTNADLVANRVASFMTEAQQDALDLAGRSTLAANVDHGDWAALDRQLERWLTLHGGRFSSVNVFDLNGTVVATGLPDKSVIGRVNTADRDWYQELIRTEQPFLGQAVQARTTNHLIVPFGMPLHGSDGKLKALMTTGISLESMSNMLLGLEWKDSTRPALIDYQHGLLLVHPDPTRILGQPSGRNAAVQRAIAGERGFQDNLSSADEPTLAAFSPVPGLQWTVLIQEPTAQAYAPIEAMTWRALAWVGVAAVLVALLTGSAAVWITRPLRALRASAERMADGDLGRRTGLARSDEIGDLSRAFDRMAEQLQGSVRDLTSLALTDAVTGLPNRVLLRQTLRQALADATARGANLALLVMDLDRFKEVNDTLGHQNGDLLLAQVGQRLKDAVRDGDTIARLGGDEFAVVLPEASLEAAGRVAEALLRELSQPFDLDGQSVAIGVSIGVSVFPDPSDPTIYVDADCLLRRGDVAMYVAKRSGAGWSGYSLEQDRHSRERLALRGELRSAIGTDALALYFQPKLACDGRTVAGVEALVRWPHPVQGMVPPVEFVPLAEQTGLIHALSRWVLRAALRQQRAWCEAGLDLPVSVNLSMRDLHDARLPETIAALLEEQGVAASALRVELTESTLMSDPERALEVLSGLRALGVRISVDDFGTGYSSLSYLKRLPVDELKIDRSFVRDMATDDNDRAIVRSTVDLAHNLGLQVVAEGVEDNMTLGLLRRLGCDEVQGFLFTQPLPADQLFDWLEANHQAAA